MKLQYADAGKSHVVDLDNPSATPVWVGLHAGASILPFPSRANMQRRAQAELDRTDYVAPKALEQGRTLSPHWIAWREQLRDVVRGNSMEIPDEPDRWMVELEAPLLPAPDALMSDWGEVGPAADDAPYPGVPDDFVQLMTGDETLEQAVERMTLGVDELLDMATVLSDQSLELALCTVPPERVNEWTEKLITEKARLRRLRGTVDENFGRENLVSRVQGMFAQVGAKR